MIYAIGTFVSFFLAVLILTKQGRYTADIILGAWMIVTGLHLFAYYSIITGLIYEHTFLLGVNLPFPFLHGPLLYLYTFALTKPAELSKKIWLVNAVLPLGIVVSTIPFFSLKVEEKMHVFQNDGLGYETYTLIAGILLSASGIAYVFLTNKLLINHKKRIRDVFSSQEKVDLDWLRFLFYGMGLIWVFIIFDLGDQWIFILATVFVIFIGYFGIRQVGIFSNQPLLTDEGDSIPEAIPFLENEEKNTEKRKYAKSGLNDDAAMTLHGRLTSLMNQQRLYREPELTLVQLATHLDVHPNYLSQVINDREGFNFYDYVNGLRIEEFKKEIAKPENRKFTLLAVAYNCGFNSKSSFNRFFKKAEGKSPTAYLKEHNFPVSTSFS
jgi:AraC-like DNA-binding protein